MSTIKSSVKLFGNHRVSYAASRSDAGLEGFFTTGSFTGCHQPDGSGSADGDIPDMRGSIGHYLRLPEGRAYLVQVPGTTQSSLNDGDTAELLNWMVKTLGEKEVPADFSPYTRDEVTRLRRNPIDDVPAVRTSLVGRLQKMGYRIE